MGYFDSFKNAWKDIKGGDFGALKNDVFDKFSPLYQIYHQKPADLQRAAYQSAADKLDALGREQRDWYLAQGDKALSFYGKGGEVGQPQQPPMGPTPDYYAGAAPPPTGPPSKYPGKPGGGPLMAYAWKPPKLTNTATPAGWGNAGAFGQAPTVAPTSTAPAPVATPPAGRPATPEEERAAAQKATDDAYKNDPDFYAAHSPPVQMTGIPEPLPQPGTGGLTPDQAILNQQANRPTQMGDFYDTLAGHGAPTYQSDYYDYAKGEAGKPTNTETLYDERKGGYDPAAQYDDARATKAINDQFAARGGYNSGAATRQISDYYANSAAQRSKQLADLASGADAGRLGRDAAYGNAAAGAGGAESDYYNLLGHAAGGASSEQSDYYSGLTRAATDIAGGKAGVSQHTTDMAGKVFSDAEFEKIQAELKKAGVDVSQIKNDKESLQTLVSLYAGGAGGAAGKAGGGAGGGAGAGDTSKSWYV